MPEEEAALHDKLHGRVGTHVKRLEQIIHTAKTHALRELGLTVAQYATVNAIETLQPTSQAQLARAIHATPQTMSTILSNLDQKDLISKHSSGIHQKVILIELTTTGQDLLARADALTSRIEQTYRERIGEDRFSVLLEITQILQQVPLAETTTA